MKNIKLIITSTLLFSSYSFASEPLEIVNNDKKVEEPKDYRISLELDVFSYSEILPVVEIFGGAIPITRIAREQSRSRQPDAGQVALTHDRASLQAQYKNWIFQIVGRYDYHIEFTADAAQLFYLERNELPVDKENYDLYLSANHVRASGIGFGYQFEYKGLSITPYFNYWQGEYMEDGELDGVFTVNDDLTEYSASGSLDYHYINDAILRRPNIDIFGDASTWDTDGYGLNIDVHFAYDFNEDWKISGRLYDLWNKFEWDNLGYSYGDLTTETRTFNSDGSFSVDRPILSGTETSQDHSQSIAPQLKLRGDGQFDLHYFDLNVWSEQYIANEKWFPSFGIGYEIFNTNLELGYQLESEALMAAVRHEYVRFGFIVDSFDFDEAKTVGIDFAVNVKF